MFENEKPSIRFSMVGFGQAGSRIANEFAKFNYKGENGTITNSYPVFAFNSTERDFGGLDNIPKANLVSLNLDGFGKEPTKAYQKLKSTPEYYNSVEEMVDKAYKAADELIIFNAGLGGGTGTSTVLLATQIFIKKYVQEVIEKYTKQLIEANGFDYEDFMTDPNYANNPEVMNSLYSRAEAAAENAGELKKLGLILAYPKRTDGPGVLKEVNRFIEMIWKLVLSSQNRIAFMLPVDNQKASDDYAEHKSDLKFETYRDYINHTIAAQLHELNCATNIGGSDVTFDAQDFRKCILEHQGTLVIGKNVKSVSEVNGSNGLYKSLTDAWISGHNLHDKIEWEVEQNGKTAYHTVYNVGLLTIVNSEVVEEKKINTSYLDDTQDKLSSELSLYGDCKVFTGQIESKDIDKNVYSYTFAKTQALPNRLSTGLVEEYEQYKERTKQEVFVTGEIKSLNEAGELSPKKVYTFEDPFAVNKSNSNDDFLSAATKSNTQSDEEKKEKQKQAFLDSLVNGGNNPFGI